LVQSVADGSVSNSFALTSGAANQVFTSLFCSSTNLVYGTFTSDSKIAIFKAQHNLASPQLAYKNWDAANAIFLLLGTDSGTTIYGLMQFGNEGQSFDYK